MLNLVGNFSHLKGDVLSWGGMSAYPLLHRVGNGLDRVPIATGYAEIRIPHLALARVTAQTNSQDSIIQYMINKDCNSVTVHQSLE